jgi:hypothetical protein
MNRTVAAFGVLTLLMSGVELHAQTPNLSGTWTVVAAAAPAAPAAPAAGAPPGGGGRAGGGGRGGGRGGFGGLGQAATIAQTATQLTINRTVADAQVRSVYNLDGSESSNTMSFGGNEIVQTSRASWDGSKLVIRTAAMGGQGGETVMALSLKPTGQLVLETTAPGRGGGAPTTTPQTYTK